MTKVIYCISSWSAKNLTEDAHKTLQGLSNWFCLIPNGLGQLKLSPGQQLNYESDFCPFCGTPMRLHLQGQRSLQEESIAILHQARVKHWTGHGTEGGEGEVVDGDADVEKLIAHLSPQAFGMDSRSLCCCSLKVWSSVTEGLRIA